MHRWKVIEYGYSTCVTVDDIENEDCVIVSAVDGVSPKALIITRAELDIIVMMRNADVGMLEATLDTRKRLCFAWMCVAWVSTGLLIAVNVAPYLVRTLT